MAGFGFLRQMSETFKYNRDLLGKPKREPFDNGLYKNAFSVDTNIETGEFIWIPLLFHQVICYRDCLFQGLLHVFLKW